MKLNLLQEKSITLHLNLKKVKGLVKHQTDVKKFDEEEIENQLLIETKLTRVYINLLISSSNSELKIEKSHLT
jgi:hypothetical protein